MKTLLRSAIPGLWAVLAACGLLGGLVTLGAACSSAPTVNPFEVVDDDSGPREKDLLDAPVEAQPRRVSTAPRTGQAVLMVPDAPDEMSRTIDGDGADWDLSSARTFAGKEFVQSGAAVWTGPADASFRASIASDDGFIYFFVDVRDDVIIDSSPDAPVDAVVIWLRDPRLDTLLKVLPASLANTLRAQSEVAVAITPDGQFARHASHESLPAGAVTAAATRRDDGYSVEVAIQMAALGHVASIPLMEVAFRIELLDGDRPDRPRTETVLSMLPETGGDAPRFAVYGLGGLLPHRPLIGQPARADALGAWRLSNEGWRFNTLEVVSPNWHIIEDLSTVQRGLANEEAFPEVCAAPGNDVWLIDAYQANNGSQRVGLILCASSPRAGTCVAGASAQVVWVHMALSGDTWHVRDARPVFEEPLEQCAFERVANKPFYADISLFPMSVLSPTAWAVGWTRTHNTREFRSSEDGVTIVDGRSTPVFVGEVITNRTWASKDTRILSRSEVYFTDLDSAPGLDICEVERVEEQDCKGFNTNCRLRDRGRQTITHIKTWNPNARRFEPYLLSRHPRCSPQLTFDDVKGFMLLHVNQRLGLLAAPGR